MPPVSAPITSNRKILPALAPALAVIIGLGSIGQTGVESGAGAVLVSGVAPIAGPSAPIGALKAASFDGHVSTTVKAFDLSAYSNNDFGDNP